MESDKFRAYGVGRTGEGETIDRYGSFARVRVIAHKAEY